MNVATLVSRAYSGIGKATRYESPGKMPGFDALTWPMSGARCDCSGFIDWCLRAFPGRKVDHPLYKRVNGGWFETTAIHADGLASTGYFSPLANPRVGAFLVYPDYVDSTRRQRDGHIGLIVETAGNDIAAAKVIHCSFGSWKNLGDAIQVTGPDAWTSRKESLIVWFDGLEE